MAAILSVLMAGSVTVTIDQAGGLSAAQLQVAVAQMADVWRAAGVEVAAAQSDDRPTTGHAAVSLRIVTLRAKSIRGDRPVLAWIGARPGGRTAPVLIVSLPAVAAMVAEGEYAGRGVKRLPSNLTGWLVARAIGRVAAHELGHYLLQQHATHQRRGLMRPTYSTADLLGDALDPFRVAPEQRSAAMAEIAALARSQHVLQP